MLDYSRPDNLEDALLTLSEQPCTLLAGGTDFYPARVGEKITENVLDLSGIRGLRSIQETEEGFLLGALTTWFIIFPFPNHLSSIRESECSLTILFSILELPNILISIRVCCCPLTIF